jgi:hypothetical protein
LSLANPLGLLLLTAIPVIIVLHLFRQERRRREVSSLYLWREITDQQSRRVRPRLLRNINLLLQLIVVILASLALAEPSISVGSATGAGRMILIVDDSASMQAASSGASRMELARSAASEIVGRSPRTTQFLLMTGGPRPRILETFTLDRTQLYESIDAIQATDGANDFRSALELVQSIGVGDDTDVVFVTDGAVDLQDETVPLEFAVNLVGEPAANQAITAFELRNRRDASAIEMLGAVANYSSEPATVQVDITADGEFISTRSFDLEPFEERLFSSVIGRRRGAVYQAVLADHEDALAVDDAAYAAAAGERPIRIQLVTPGNLFLESILSVYPNVDLTIRESVSQTNPWDILILDRVPAPSGLRGNVITFDTALPDGPFTAAERVQVERSISTLAGHPLVNGVRLDLVRVSEAIGGELLPRATVVASAGDIPLLYTYRRDRLTLVGTTFSLGSSDIALRGSFPVLIHNMIEWLAPVSPAGDVGYAQVGSTVPLYVPPGEEVVVIAPDNDAARFTPRVSPFEYEQTARAGIYEVRGESFTSRFAVSLANAGESNLAPRLRGTAAVSAAAAEEEAGGRPIWQWLALAALIVLAVDWVIWARRH